MADTGSKYQYCAHYDRLSREAETAKKVREALANPGKRQKSTSENDVAECAENSGNGPKNLQQICNNEAENRLKSQKGK